MIAIRGTVTSDEKEDEPQQRSNTPPPLASCGRWNKAVFYKFKAKQHYP
ncbi:hypothetical protein GCM10007338_16200 [Corynebacterium pelargi]|nr:hypothetical protein GCM10007338_16200 [Corynebacterium pelargi]